MPWKIVGHEWAVNLLRNDLVSDRPSHAYLFTGADGVGKRTLALQFACAACCPNPPEPGIPCGSCRACRLMMEGRHPDLHILQPQGPSGKILVDAARALSASLSLKPLEARYRIALLQDFHRAHVSAANALLKTIEEPAPSVILLLTADTADELLPTIVSRCRVVSLRPVPPMAVEKALIQHCNVEVQAARNLASRSGGRIGWAIAEATRADSASDRETLFQSWLQTFRQTRAERFALAYSLSSDRAQALGTLRGWQSFAHDLQMLQANPSAQVTNMDFRISLHELAIALDVESVRSFFSALRKAEDGIDRNANIRLALEAALLEAPSL